jgi:uncharacterized protein (DUF488 family)
MIYTIGHSTRSMAELIDVLRDARIDCVVDVRKFPHSRRHPHFNREALGPALAAAGLGYRHVEALGGRRGKRRDGPSPNGLWREEAFRNFADYAGTAPFRDALAELRSLGRSQRVAIMCAEAVWWRCHRRIIADYLIAAGEDVTHIFDLGKGEPARLTPGAVPQPDGVVLYPPEQAQLPL